MNAARQKAARVRLVVFDVDGVLTDGRLILGDDGSEYKAFHVHDGLGLNLLREAGIQVAVISARSSKVTAERMAALGIEYVYQGSENKAATFAELIGRVGVTPQEVAYIGDDLLDLPVLRRAGFAATVADAHPLVREHVDFITTAPGGGGAAREICDLILGAQGKLQALIQRYLERPS